MSQHVVILGAGVIGLSVAAEATRRGYAVTVIERDGPTRRGCSFGNAGMVVPSHFIPLAAPGAVALGLKWMWNPESPFYIQPRWSWDLFTWAWRFYLASNAAQVAHAAPLLRDLHLASRAAFAAAAESGEDFGLTKKGLLMLCRTPSALEAEAHVAEEATRLGLPAEVCDARRAAALDPGVTMDIAGAVYFPLDCHLTPERYMAALERQVTQSRGNFLWNCAVTGWRRENGRLRAVQTTRGDIEADHFVLCGGSWSDKMVRDLGLRLPLQAGKGYSLTLPEPPELPHLCAIFTEARVAITPMGGSLRVGGTMEMAGLSAAITARRVAGIVKAVPQYYPRFGPEHFDQVTPWAGLRPCSPDGLPYLGRTRAAKNLLIATGHAMMGVSLAPATGQCIAQLLDGEPPAWDLTLLSPDRFA